MTLVSTADGTRLDVTTWGEGPPVVFLHAWALSSDQWAYQVPDLVGHGLRCVTVDRRGHGRSERSSGGYDVDTFADDLAAVLDHLDLHDVTLVAHSVGSKDAVRYLTRHGDARVRRLVLMAPTTPFLRGTEDNEGLPAGLIAENRAAVARNLPQWCADFEAFGPYFGESPGGTAGLVDWTVRMIVDTPLHVLLATLDANTDVDMRSELPAIRVPTLILHGDQDASAPIELTGRRTRDLIPGAKLIEYPGCGHGLYASDHERVNADILRFIEERASAAQ